MLISIAIIISAFNWLLVETDYLRIRLLTGTDDVKPDYSGDCALKIYHSLKNKPTAKMGDYDVMETDNYNFDCPSYYLMLSPNVEPMCKEWLCQNYNKLVTYKPQTELDYGSYRQRMTFYGDKYQGVINKVLRIHDKKFVAALANKI